MENTVKQVSSDGAGIGPYHIVLIGFACGQGWRKRIATFQANSLVDAAKAALDRKFRRITCCTVLRDGGTGKRYSIAQCASLVGGCAHEQHS